MSISPACSNSPTSLAGLDGWRACLLGRYQQALQDFCHANLLIGIDIRRSRASTITEGDLILIGAEKLKIIGEPKSDALVFAFEACLFMQF
jgi:hypothetical protein